MTVKEAVSLLHYGTRLEIKGAYSGKIYHSSSRNKKENLEKYYDEEVVSEPFYTTMHMSREKDMCFPAIGIWMYDYNLQKNMKTQNRRLRNDID